MKNILLKYLLYLGTPALILIGGYFSFIFATNAFKGYVDNKLDTERSKLVNEIEYFEQGFSDRINVLQRKLDENSEAIEASAKSIPSPNLFQRLFNTELNKTRNEILSSIPEIIQEELESKDLDVESTASIDLQVEGDTIRFPADQEYIEGYWGSLKLIDDQEGVEPYFELTFVPIDIGIEEIRTIEDPAIGQQRVFITATDKRNGNEINITSTNFNFIEERSTGFRFDPQFSTGIHNIIQFDNPLNVGINIRFSALGYEGNKNSYDFLTVNSTIYENERSLKHFTAIGIVDITF